MATRHQVREAIVGLLYAKDMGNESIDKELDEILDEKKIRNKQKDFAVFLYKGINENLQKIDETINLHLKEWQLENIASVEKSILRLGAYEILFENIDNAVAINEAIELSKKLCNDPSSKLINGVLDAIRKDNE